MPCCPQLKTRPVIRRFQTGTKRAIGFFSLGQGHAERFIFHRLQFSLQSLLKKVVPFPPSSPDSVSEDRRGFIPLF